MRGAPVNVPNKNGFTPLHIAAQLNSIDSVLVLLNIGEIGGVDVNSTTLSGFTPLYLARAAGL